MYIVYFSNTCSLLGGVLDVEVTRYTVHYQHMFNWGAVEMWRPPGTLCTLATRVLYWAVLYSRCGGHQVHYVHYQHMFYWGAVEMWRSPCKFFAFYGGGRDLEVIRTIVCIINTCFAVRWYHACVAHYVDCVPYIINTCFTHRDEEVTRYIVYIINMCSTGGGRDLEIIRTIVCIINTCWLYDGIMVPYIIKTCSTRRDEEVTMYIVYIINTCYRTLIRVFLPEQSQLIAVFKNNTWSWGFKGSLFVQDGNQSPYLYYDLYRQHTFSI
jgi:hypothetical protein